MSEPSGVGSYDFLKGHGTQNDFVILPDLDGDVHGHLDDEQFARRVRALCDRRAGIGADGVLRVLRATHGPSQYEGWFMDYRNADGSVAEMCGNGVRVFVRYLLEEGLLDAGEGAAPGEPVLVGTRDGVKTVTAQPDGQLTVDMGEVRLLGDTTVSLGERRLPAVGVDLGNPHAVAFVDSLDPVGVVGPLLEAPGHDPALYPDGVNVEFVVRRGAHHVAMRVHERGSGETRSCGTGACAVAVAAALADDERDVDYTVDLPGGTLVIRPTSDGRVLMTGPAEIVARGTTSL